MTGREVRPLEQNSGRSFQGPIPVGEGFIVSDAEAQSLLRIAGYEDVVRRYLIGDDIAHSPYQGASRWIIDFGQRSLEAAQTYPEALKIVRERVKPDRDANRDPGFRTKWWLFGRPRGEMREALTGLGTFLAGTATGKRLLLTRVEPSVSPSNLVNVFAFDDDYSMGILMSRAHDAWAWSSPRRSRLDSATPQRVSSRRSPGLTPWTRWLAQGWPMRHPPCIHGVVNSASNMDWGSRSSTTSWMTAPSSTLPHCTRRSTSRWLRPTAGRPPWLRMVPSSCAGSPGSIGDRRGGPTVCPVRSCAAAGLTPSHRTNPSHRRNRASPIIAIHGAGVAMISGISICIGLYSEIHQRGRYGQRPHVLRAQRVHVPGMSSFVERQLEDLTDQPRG